MNDIDLYVALTHLCHAVRLFANDPDIVRRGVGSPAFAALCRANDEAEAVRDKFVAQNQT